MPKSTYVTLAHKRKPKFFYFGCSLVRRCNCKQSTSANGTDGQTDRRTDRVRRNMRPPPREEGRIIINPNTEYAYIIFSPQMKFTVMESRDTCLVSRRLETYLHVSVLAQSRRIYVLSQLESRSSMSRLLCLMTVLVCLSSKRTSLITQNGLSTTVL